MQYRPIEFPPRIAFGAQRAPMWATGIVQTASGHEFADQRWADARHAFDISFAVRTAEDYGVIVEHFHSVRGRAFSFPFHDHLDYRVEAANGVLLDAPPSSPSEGYQLAKRYGSGDYAWDRAITKPAEDTVVVLRTRASVTTDVTGSCTIDLDTGRTVIAGGVVLPGDTLAWSGEFFVPCRYDTDRLPTLIVNRQPGADGQLFVQCDSIQVLEVRPDPDDDLDSDDS
jgi:uncharacterized protein (TIGR02217 family)